MFPRKSVAFALSAFLLIAGSAAAEETLYLAMHPDTEFCMSIHFGDSGRGDYTLLVDDPGYPGRGWIDTHLTSFTSGPNNPVLVPICFITKDRRVGEEALLRFTMETPSGEKTSNIGICVSRHEDADVVESPDNPCRAASSHTDVFSADLAEDEKYSIPGERVKFTLLVSSEFDMRVILDKESGPKMNITSTVVDMPGDQSVDIFIDSPDDPGDYVFTITARAEGCDDPSCQKKMSGILHVAQSASMEGFRVEISPRNKNVPDSQAAKLYVTIHNFEAEQEFRVNVEMDASLETDFNPLDVKVPKDKSAQIDFTVIPGTDEHKLYLIRVFAQSEQGIKKSAESFLTVEEPVSDAGRYAESDPGLRPEADDYADSYHAGASLDDWQNIQDLGRTSGDDPTPPPNNQPGYLTWILIAGAVVAGASIIFFIYKRTVVSQGTDPQLP